jgi:hypothetical protein
MARTFSRPSQAYPGDRTFGPFSLDGITRADTDALVATFTVEGWPQDVDPLLVVRVRWDNGAGGDFAIPGRQVNKDGTPRSLVTLQVDVPQKADGKAAVSGGTIEIDTKAPLTTAVTFEAVAFGAAARRR